MENTTITTTSPQLGRPINVNSARQIRIAELEEKRKNGTCKRGRPNNGESKRQETLKAREAKVSNGGELKRGRPIVEGSKRQIELAAKEARKAAAVTVNQ
jgi:hypothetical protein